MVEPYLAEIITISAILIGNAIRTLIPWYNKLQAEIRLAESEGREPKLPTFHYAYAVSAAISIVLLSVPLLATMDTFMAKIIDVASPVMAFFILLLAAIGTNEILNMGISSGIVKKENTT